MKILKIALQLLIICFSSNNLNAQLNEVKDTSYNHQFLQGQIPKFAIPVAYDFGHTSNILISTNEEESSISSAVNIYSKTRKNDCDECRIGNQIFARGKLTFPDNQIKNEMELSNLLVEIGYRYILPSSASYYTMDTHRKFDIEDTCSFNSFCKSWVHTRAFDLNLDYSFATEKWLEFSLVRQNYQYSKIINLEATQKKMQEYRFNLSYNFYRKFNHRVLSFYKSNLRYFQYIGCKISAQIGQFNNLAILNKYFLFDSLNSSSIDGKLVYSTSELIVGESPSTGYAANFSSIIAFGFTNWLSLSFTPGRMQAFSSSISGLSASTIRCDLLLKLPKLEDCENSFTRNVTIGFNVKFQHGRVPIYGIGANIPFE